MAAGKVELSYEEVKLMLDENILDWGVFIDDFESQVEPQMSQVGAGRLDEYIRQAWEEINQPPGP